MWCDSASPQFWPHLKCVEIRRRHKIVEFYTKTNLTLFVRFSISCSKKSRKVQFCMLPMEIFVCYHLKPAQNLAFLIVFNTTTFFDFMQKKPCEKFLKLPQNHRFDEFSIFMNFIRGEHPHLWPKRRSDWTTPH